jgi:thiosulfate dehydrogenase [quinone] large subunit
MSSLSSSDPSKPPAVESPPPQERASPPQVRLSERSLISLSLVRIFFGFLWFQQLGWKMPPDFAGLRPDVVREVHYTILPGYSHIVQQVFLAHFSLLGTSLWAAEFLVSLSLLFGLFTRLGALLAWLLSVQLYVGIAYAPGEWYWSYGMLLLLSLVFVAVPAGRRLGGDQVLWPWLAKRAKAHPWARLLVWTA